MSKDSKPTKKDAVSNERKKTVANESKQLKKKTY